MAKSPSGEELLEAIRSGDRERVRALLQHEPGLAGTKVASGESAALLATYYGHEEIAADIIRTGVATDLHESAALGLTERVRAHLASGATDVNALSFDGWTALHLAAFFGRLETARVLLEAGARQDRMAQNAQANLPLHAATAGRRMEVVNLLLEHGADVDAPTAQGWTALHLAAHGGYLELVETLLMRGATPQARNADGETPLDLAMAQGKHDVALRLRAAGAAA